MLKHATTHSSPHEEYAERIQDLERENALYRNLLTYIGTPPGRAMAAAGQFGGGEAMQRLHAPSTEKQGDIPWAASFGQWAQGAFSHSSDGIFFINLADDGGLELAGCNPAAQSLITCADDASIGVRLEDGNSFGLSAVLSGNARHCLECGRQICRKDCFVINGAERSFHATTIPVRDGSTFNRVICILRDRTESQKAEEALLAREQEFRTLAENSPDVIIRYDRECRRTFLNTAHERASGRPSTEFLGKTPLEVSAIGATAPAFQAMIQRVLESGAPVDADLEGVDPSGDVKCYSFRVIPEFGPDGTVQGALSVARDITERKRAEKELHAREQEFRALAENSPDMIIRYDRGCRRTFLNPAHERASGRPAAEYLGKTPVEKSYFTGMAAPFQAHLQTVLETGAQVSIDLDETDPSGGYKCYSFNIAPEFDQDGTVKGALSIGRDITERKRAERELRESEAELQRRLDFLHSPDAGISSEDLNGILSVPDVQALVDAFVMITKAPIGILDLQGKILVSAGWQDICTKFHRVHAQTRANCLESDTRLAEVAKPGETFAYKCRNNMWDVVTPLFIAGRHVANIFTGQFFFEDEHVDRAAFIAQARQYGFDPEAYCQALARTPRFSRDTVEAVMDFLLKLANLVSSMGLGNLRQSKALAELQEAEQALRASRDELASSRDKLALAMDLATMGAWEHDCATGQFIFDDRFFSLYATSCEREGGTGMPPEAYAREFLPPEDAVIFRDKLDSFLSAAPGTSFPPFEQRILRRDGVHRDIVVRAKGYWDKGGRLVRLIGANQDITERKRAEAELHVREQELSTLVENTPDMIVRFDRDCRRIFVNNAMSRIFGIPAQDLLGKTPLECSGLGDEAARCQARLQEVLQTGVTAEFDVALTDYAGRQRCYTYLILAERDRNGDIVSALSITRDITERKRAEEDLIRSERFLSTLLESIPVPVFHKDAQGRYVLCNSAFEGFLGVGKGEIVGKSVFDLTPPHLAEIYHAKDRELLEAPGSQRYETQVQTAEMGLRDVILHKATYTGADGAVQGIVGAVLDISERKRAEAALIASKERLASMLAWKESIINVSAVGVLVVTRNRVITEVNTGAAEMFGYEPGELLGRSVEMLHVNHQMYKEFGEKYWGGTSRAKVVTIEWRLRKKSGESIWCKLSGSAINQQDIQQGVVWLALDVTERRKAQDALRAREQEFRTLSENSPDLITRFDGKFLCIYANPAFERTTGVTSAALLGRKFEEMPLFNAQSRTTQKKFRQVAENCASLEIDLAWTSSSGRGLCLNTRAIPESDDKGRIASVLVVCRDISSRKMEEAILLARAQEFRTLVEHNPDLIVRYDLACRRVFANPAFIRAIGIPERDYLGKTPLEISRLGEYALEYQDNLRKVLRTGVTVQGELQWPDPEGNGRDFSYHIVAEYGGDGKIASAMVVARDITARKRADEALATRELEFRTLAENSPDMIIRYDRDCRRSYVNPATVRVTGNSAEDLLGKTPLEGQTLGQAAHSYQEKLREVFKTRSSCEVELEFHRDGMTLYYSYRLAPEFAPDGTVGSVLAIGHDITERKQAEAALFAREQEYRALVDNSPSTISRFDRQCRRIFANPELVRQSSTTLDRLLGKTPEEFPGGEGAALYMEKLREALQGNAEIEFELEWRSTTGQEYVSLLRLVPEFGQDQDVSSVLAVGIDITEIHRSRRKIHDLAFYDILTGMPNRALFNDRARQALAEAGWHGNLVGVMLMDLDHFKLINDTMGHAAGDELLREVANRLRNSLRVYDTVARLGGDEFVFLLPEVRSAEDVGAIAGKILGTFADPFTIDRRELFVSTSIGIAMYPYDETEIEGLLKCADTALYHAKALGRGNFQFYSEELTVHAKKRLALENDLCKCIERNELELFYQPKVDMQTKTIIGAEALLRWNHPRLGLVGPDLFIGIAEDKGYIVEIGEWVLKSACRAARLWNENSAWPLKIAVNLSARQFKGNDLVVTVSDTLSETGCRPEWIELEITESLLLDKQEERRTTLEAFQNMGISIALDDFGTGYSAMSYLTRYPINTLKIDRSFIINMTTHPDSATLVRAITSLAHSLHMNLVAEGVELPEQVESLLGIGCILAQGYLFGKPMPYRQFEKLLAAQS